MLIGIAIGVSLVLTVICSLTLHASRNAAPSDQSSGVMEASATVSTETTSTTPSEPQYRQPTPTMIRIADDGQLWAVIRFTYDDDLLMTEYSEEYFTDGAVDWTVQASMTYDDQSRLIRRDIVRSDMVFEDGTSGYYIYTYDTTGNLISRESRTFEGGAEVTYTYDAQNRLIHTIEEYGLYTLTTDYIYDDSGNVERREESYDYGNGDIRKETQLEDGEPATTTDYKPFEFTFYKGEWTSASISITGNAGQAIWTTSMSAPELLTNEYGYVTEIRNPIYNDTVRTYSIYYNGEVPSEQSGNVAQPKASLSYPISLDDCYIIYRNYYGRDMRDGNTVEVSHSTENGENVLYFFMKDYFIKGEPPVTYEVFKVFVDSGKCTGGAESHSDRWPTFQAGDYYP